MPCNCEFVARRQEGLGNRPHESPGNSFQPSHTSIRSDVAGGTEKIMEGNCTDSFSHGDADLPTSPKARAKASLQFGFPLYGACPRTLHGV